MTRYSADNAAEAARTVSRVHTLIVRAAADLMATDPRITPVGAVTAAFTTFMEATARRSPHVLGVYRRALELLGIPQGRGAMTYTRFISYAPAGDRLRLTGDRKVAGAP